MVWNHRVPTFVRQRARGSFYCKGGGEYLLPQRPVLKSVVIPEANTPFKKRAPRSPAPSSVDDRRASVRYSLTTAGNVASKHKPLATEVVNLVNNDENRVTPLQTRKTDAVTRSKSSVPPISKNCTNKKPIVDENSDLDEDLDDEVKDREDSELVRRLSE